jgi:DNA repair protein RecN (Recombination protein N)
MVLTALALLGGAKADPGLVSSAAEAAVVEGFYAVPMTDNPSLNQILDECGAALDESVLIVNREIPKEGRARCVVGGKSVPASVAGEIAEHLVTVHGQGDQARIAKPSQQRELLDSFAGKQHLALVDELALVFANWREARRALENLKNLSATSARELVALQEDIALVTALEPQEGELAALNEEIATMMNAEEIMQGLSAVVAHLEGDGGESPGASASLNAASAALGGLTKYGQQFESIRSQLLTTLDGVNEVLASVRRVFADLDLDPARLAAAQQRKADLIAAAKRLVIEPENLTSWLTTAQARAFELDPNPERLTQLEAEVQATQANLLKLAAEVSDSRVSAARLLSSQVTKEINELALPNAQFVAKVTQPTKLLDDISANGFDEIEFQFAAHGSSELRPLAKAASGGERSRVMLALEVALASADPVPTFVFDEVDAGVGGKAAIEVGRRLARLGHHAQVIVVTHLPQVAAFAAQQILVEKGVTAEVSKADVRLLSEAERVAELSRMLAGVGESQAAQQHAQELLEMGARERAGLVHS